VVEWERGEGDGEIGGWGFKVIRDWRFPLLECWTLSVACWMLRADYGENMKRFSDDDAGRAGG
jgi:hypothetical protein